MKKWLISGAAAAAFVLLAVMIAVFWDELVAKYFEPTPTEVVMVEAGDPEVVAENLVTPWSIAELPDGELLVTERSGTLVRIANDDIRTTIDGVQETSEGGLLGMALDPEFEDNQHIYLYYTTGQGGTLTNQVDRYTLGAQNVTDRQVVIDEIPAASTHNGGAIAFGPDDMLYITTGDAAQEDLAQDTESLAGKILRLNPDGSIPDNNPFDNAVWSYGHRNPQGIAWDDSGQLWAVEHGPSGVETGRDELNRIERGNNYGWPTITGDEMADDMKSPVIHSGVDDTWAPSGMAYYEGALYFAGLRGQSLYRYTINTGEIARLYSEEYGRLRAVTATEDGLYVSTSNRDGRGSPRASDDRILRIRP